MVVKRTNSKIVRCTRSAALALIAMLELLLLCVSLTFSWFEIALDPILVGDGISTAPSLLSVVNVTGSANVSLPAPIIGMTPGKGLQYEINANGFVFRGRHVSHFAKLSVRKNVFFCFFGM